ncbi:MAG TPA: FHA domain-containing serine/threonine-protein kinase, partial [Planctomycetota bacterium]|nr:FHA domain-containing serine/threonine-protein kinase [Planctomycetota bacterium]
MKVILRVRRGKYEGREFVFEKHGTLLVGRAEDAHISIPGDKAFSRHHFLIEVNPPRCFLRDLGSSNGTYVNRVQVEESMLKHGDVIAAGETRLQVAVVADQQPEAGYIPDRIDMPELDAALANPAKDDEEEGTSEVDLLTPSQAVHDLKDLDLKGVAATPAAPLTPAKAAWLERKRSMAQDLANGPPSGSISGENPALEAEDEKPDARLQIPGYHIEKLLARGGMGSIYRGEQIATGRKVAVKYVSPQMDMDESVRQMFQREIQILATLRHPNIVNLVENGRHEGLDYFVMELIDGVNLEKYVKKGAAPLPVKTAVGLACQALDALQYAHYCNIVHRDIKPGNFMIEMRSGLPFVRMLDFGLAKNYEDAGNLTMTGDFKGTLYFVPPEQIKNTKAVGPQSDLFSLGAVLYYMLTGKYLYDTRKERVGDLLRSVLDANVVPIVTRGVTLPPELVVAVNKSLARETTKRY